MERRSGQLGPGIVLEEVRQLFLQAGSGVLEVRVGGGTRRLFFIEGDLYLPPSHPLAASVATSMRKGSSADSSTQLMERMATVLAGWDQGTFAFSPGLYSVPPGAVGPLPTAELLMSAAVEGDAESLLQSLGGEEAELRRRNPGERIRRVARLRAEDQSLLARLKAPHKVATLLDPSDGNREGTLRSLARLLVLGFLSVQREDAPAEPRVGPELLRPFAERVAKDLAESPITLEPEEHRSRLAELLGSLGQQDFYELLCVELDASVEQVHAAYGDLARLVHPSHAERLGLVGREAAMTVLFERATEAYLTLSDPVRRTRYNLEMGIQPQAKSRKAGAAAEQVDTGERARGLFRQAQGMVEREEYHYAVEILRQAVRFDAKAEYWALLAEVQERNPNWLKQAAESFRQALLLDPDNPAYRLGMARIFERQGQMERAVSTYRTILMRKPDQADAVAALARLGQKSVTARGPFSLKPPSERKRRGFLARFFGRG